MGDLRSGHGALSGDDGGGDDAESGRRIPDALSSWYSAGIVSNGC